MAIRVDDFTEGFAAYDGDKKLAVVHTKQNKGLAREGRIIYEDMPPDHCTVHFTNPHMKIAEVQAVLDAVTKKLHQK